MSEFSKSWEELSFRDNFIFCKVMRNSDLCRKMLEILLGIKVSKITYVSTEHPFDEYLDRRGIRMDVFIQGSDSIYDIEMQTCDYKNLPLRARYYQGAADISTTPRRTDFNKLKESYILFICKDDPLGGNLPVYTIRPVVQEDSSIPFNDKSQKIFYNSSCYEKAESVELKKVLKFIYTSSTESEFTKELKKSVVYAKADPVFKDDYMYVGDIIEMERQQAYEEAAVKKQNEISINMLNSGLTPEQIAKFTGISIETINKIKESLTN